MAKKFKYTDDFGTQGGYNSPQPGMTPVEGSGTRYYGNDGYIYNMTTGSRTRGNPPAATPDPAPAPQPVSNGYSSQSAPAPKPATTPAPVVEATQEEKRAEVTKPASGLEATVVDPVAAASPTVSYLTGNTTAKTSSRFLKKKKDDTKQSLFG